MIQEEGTTIEEMLLSDWTVTLGHFLFKCGKSKPIVGSTAAELKKQAE